MRTIYEASIWAPGAIPAEEWKYRNLKRIMFPVLDTLMFLGGLVAARYGIHAIGEFYPDIFVDIFSYILSAAAFVCIVGSSFPRLWAIEIAGRAAVFGLIVGYIAALVILMVDGGALGEARGFALFIAAIAVCPIIWRLSLLASEWQARVLVLKAIARDVETEPGE